MTATTTAPTRSRGPFVGLLVAEGVSLLGTRMSAVALPWFVLVTTGSPTRTGLVAFAEMLPYVVVLALGGPAIDRLGARRISLACDAAAAVLVALVPAAYALHALRFELLLVLVVVIGAVRGFADAAKKVVVPRVVERSGMALERATGLHDGVNRGATLVGAPVAGLLIGLFNAPAVLAVDALTFAVSAAVLAATVPAAALRVDPERDEEPAAGYFRKLAVGFSWLRRNRLMCGLAVMVCVTNLLDQGVAAVLTPLWVQRRGADPAVLGLLFGALAGGAVLGNVVAAWLGPRLPRHLTYAFGFLLVGAPRLAALVFVSSVPVILVVFLLAGLGAGVINPIIGAVLYERIPADLQARVLGALGALAWAGIPLGGLLTGWVAGGFGLDPALLIVGGAYFAATLAPFVFPSWREMNRRQVTARPALPR